jgi:hypothetical protein
MARNVKPEIRQIKGKFRADHKFSRGSDYPNYLQFTQKIVSGEKAGQNNPLSKRNLRFYIPEKIINNLTKSAT